MKSSLRLATLFFSPHFSRVTGLQRIAALLLLSGVSVLAADGGSWFASGCHLDSDGPEPGRGIKGR